MRNWQESNPNEGIAMAASVAAVRQVMMWSILTKWGNREVVRVPYPMRTEADEALADLGPDEHYMQLAKYPMTSLACRILDVSVEERKIRGFTEDRHGDRHMWTKTFRDVVVTSEIVERADGTDPAILCETYVSHTYRGELRVVGHGNRLAFEAYAKKRWPNEFESVMIRLEG